MKIKSHLNFLAEQKVHHASLLLTGMPELEGRPYKEWWRDRLGRVWSALRFGLEHLFAELAFVIPLFFRAGKSTSRRVKQDLRWGYSFFPKEFWWSIGLVAATGLILAW